MSAPEPPKDSAAFCADLVRTHDFARYAATLFLPPDQRRALLKKAVYSTGRTTAFAQDFGLVQAHWTVQSTYELLDFEAYGKPLRMR